MLSLLYTTTTGKGRQNVAKQIKGYWYTPVGVRGVWLGFGRSILFGCFVLFPCHNDDQVLWLVMIHRYDQRC